MSDHRINLCFGLLFALSLLISSTVMATEYHVAKHGNDRNPGTKSRPFLSINHAAALAKPGDCITVHAGTYRELIAPQTGGSSYNRRITYRAAKGELVSIKGSEIIKGWKEIEQGIWEVSLPDTFFKAYNPYKDLIYGDWFFAGQRKLHTGEVYLNGKALYETGSLENILQGKMEGRPIGMSPLKALSPAFTWFTQSANGNTIITARFHDSDPNREMVEINVRPACFYPGKTGVDYLTVSGFQMSQAATQWAAPTAEQIGLIGTNWSKGWIIEDNRISDSKCVGITLGKDRSSGHNVWSADMQKDGSLHYNEMVERVIAGGWNQSTIGSHLVRNNTVFNCGAAGICGSFGAAFSQITGNHIYDIYTRRNYYGAEMAGIKIHGAIDVLIKGNQVRNAFIGLWLDWMAQGTRVSANLFLENDYVDFFPEVNHGPYLVDHNLFLSAYSLKDWSEGGAYAHNLFAGLLSRAAQDRRTPVFKAHTTELTGIHQIKGGDNQFYNNIFCGRRSLPAPQPKMHAMDNPDSLAGYGLKIYDHAAFLVKAAGNAYVNSAAPLKTENTLAAGAESPFSWEILEDSRGTVLKLNASKGMGSSYIISGLNNTIVSGQSFGNADGGRAPMFTDYFGKRQDTNQPVVGPFINLKPGQQDFLVWPKQVSTKK
jgi:hypothetical protein